MEEGRREGGKETDDWAEESEREKRRRGVA